MNLFLMWLRLRKIRTEIDNELDKCRSLVALKRSWHLEWWDGLRREWEELNEGQCIQLTYGGKVSWFPSDYILF